MVSVVALPDTSVGTFGDTGSSCFLSLATALASAFLSGRISPETAAAVKALFPGASFVSISVLAAGKLLITERNLIEPRCVEVSFERLEQTLAGQAVIRNNTCQATLTDSRAPLPKDLEWAYSKGLCHKLTAAPISQRCRRASSDFGAAQPWLSCLRANSTSDDCLSSPAAASLQHRRRAGTRGPPLGSLTLGMPKGRHLSSMHLKNLNDLAETLAPILEHHCNDILGGLKTLFCQPQVLEPESDSEQESGSERAWTAARSVDDYIDTLVYRLGLKELRSHCKPQHRQAATLEAASLPEASQMMPLS